MIPTAIDLDLPVPGGILPVERLRLMAECAMGAAQGVLIPGLRQEIIIPLVNPAAPMALQFLRERVENGAANIVSSAPAVDICDGSYWLNHELSEELAASFTSPPCALSFVDPRQSLVPRFASRLNFLAESDPGMWRPWVCGHEEVPVRLPIQLQTEEIASFLLSAGSVLADTLAPAVEIARALQSLGFGTPEYQGDIKPLAPPPPHHVDGFHRAIDGTWWLGLFNRDQPFSAKLLVAVAVLAREQGIGSVFVTPRRSIVIKGIRESALHAWRCLLGRYGAATCHAEEEHGWLMGNHGAGAMKLRAAVIERLHTAGATLAGVEIAIGTISSCPRGGIELRISEPGPIKSLLQGGGLVSVHVRPNLDPESGPLRLVAQDLRRGDAAGAVVEQIEEHVGRKSLRSAMVPQQLAATGVEMPVLQCSECQSHFDGQQCGDFESLPVTWTCLVCDAPKSAYGQARHCTDRLIVERQSA